MKRLVFYGRLPKFTWRMVAVVLAAEAMCIFFGALAAWALAAAGAGSDRATSYLVGGCLLAALAVLGAGLMRTPYGVTIAWLVQVLALASAVVVPIMLVVGGLFAALFIVCLVQGSKVDEAQALREAEMGPSA